MIVLAYIGPGPGFAVQAPALAVFVGVGLAFFLLLTFPLRYLLRRPGARRPTSVGRVVVVGLDGLEPTLAERWMSEGRLPHLQALATQGSYQRLATTCPPLSPVAWSSFATGVNPGKHGIFGFLHRRRDFSPYLAFSQVEKVKNRFRPRGLRKSKSFWKVLGEHGVFSHVLRVPVTWPAEKFHGAMLSAMGVPDLRGSQGTYTLLGTVGENLPEGEFVQFLATSQGMRAQLSVKNLGQIGITLDAHSRLSWTGQTPIQLEVGQYTPWLSLQIGKAQGIAKFMLLQSDPPRVYMTPMHIDPEKPSLPISYPPLYSVALAKLLGTFATCGLAEDTGGREDRVLSQAQFLEQVYSIHEEREKQFFHALERTREGLCLAVFDGTDRIQHMAMDDLPTLQNLYERMDGLIGRVRLQLNPTDVLLVMSDHGFKPLRRHLDLNAWLVDKGYLCMRDGSIDWSQSRVYALGLAGLHLNVKGRDAQGYLEKTEIAGLKAELIRALQELVDPDNGEHPIRRVFDAAQIYSGPYLDRGPDLVIGYSPGYRISKAAGRGEVGGTVLLDNQTTWCGDHCLDPETVPGVLFCDRPLRGGADIRDLAPTILHWFGITPPDYLEGESL